MRDEKQTLLQRLLDRAGADYRLLTHSDCRTSAESAAARASAGAAHAVGAKALIVKTKTGYAMLVLPGMARLDSQKVRGLLGKFRFARPDEVGDATDGLEIGTIPPFGRPVFPTIERLVVDRHIAAGALIGFNAACLNRSIVMSASDYARAAMPDFVGDISVSDNPDFKEEKTDD